jgi:hypothetical protein
MDSSTLLETATKILDANKRGDYTIPAEGLYPHQWLWDSCFIAIGLRHYDIERAKKEVLSLLRGQWANGMLPHMIFDPSDEHRRDRDMWRSWINPAAPDDVATSGITQPPMVAEAVVQIGKKLKLPERRTWYQTVFPALLKHHQWIYEDRDPHGEGLVLQLHPWETGLDNTPPWMFELHQHQLALWIRAVEWLRLHHVVNFVRRDTHYVPPGQRLNAIDALALYSVQRRMRRKRYDMGNMLTHSMFAIEDLAFNSILIRANEHLHDIARTIGKELPDDLHKKTKHTRDTLEQLWDAYSGYYYSRNFLTHKPIKIPTIATLLPLYSRCITKERAAQLVAHLHKSNEFGTKYPLPSVPINSEWFRQFSYWQGPTWLNTNWLVIQGLQHYGYEEEARHIAKRSLQLVGSSGCYEYFSPLTGKPAGIPNFSWTAALTIDILNSKLV